ncbi:MAG: hypothetical protein JJLCMIEE_02666 [Acidimicrobiales bacterium]|nr:MAG: hypothetical protein EDR02_09210 [Actinomycetota bacterium]MBV6509572.1 hypothetical protein [Acidimicrobiales bacterium]RIK06566.1 MAG: hypothetical protein DCC48_06535 [Acidobacteriota bacterium]
MASRRFFNPSQPQTLQIATFLLYISGFFTLIDAIRIEVPAFRDSTPYTVTQALLFVSVLLYAYGGYGIANERKWGYASAIVAAASPFLINFYLLQATGAGLGRSVIDAVLPTSDVNNVISWIFNVALLVLVLHTQSREYEKIWFK